MTGSDPADHLGPLVVAFSGARHDTHLLYVAAGLRQVMQSADRSIALTDLDRGDPRSVDPRSIDRFLVVDERVELQPRLIGWRPVDHYIAVGAPGIKPWLGLRRRQPWVGFSTMVVDEGLGSYGSPRSRLRALRREGSSPLAAVVRTASVAVAAKLPHTSRLPLFHRRGTTWGVRPEVADEFRMHVAGRRSGHTVVYLTQPWPELGVISGSAYVRHLEDVQARVMATGLQFAVRPHQHERIDRYRTLTVLANDGPAEVDQRVVDAAALLGETSSALLNVAAVFGTPAARVVAPFEPSLRADVNERQRSLLDTYLGHAIAPRAIADRLGALLDQ